MRLVTVTRLALSLGLGLGLGTAIAQPAQALDLAGLNNRNELVLFTDKAPGKARTLPVTGVEGKLLGIDLRPATNTLYGLSSSGVLYTIDTKTGAAKAGPKLSVALDAIDALVVDFNPQADRLRVIGSTGQNLRVNVETGQTIVDGKLAYSSKDGAAGKAPMVTAGAYINSYPAAKQTQLFEFDSGLPAYIVQDPPNDGQLRTIAAVKLNKGAVISGIDIYTDAKDDYHGFAVIGAALYRFDVGTGKLGRIGTVGKGDAALIDVAVLNLR
ncbi:DUF4394 domain-containing protein [Ferrovibrio sp.]|uniref:DUF4394 domain-containing protein n=1 Tax=Ferrovibrio sp. TaxID=1917215 RepID=UPI003D2A12A5